MPITYRSEKGAPLTIKEMDDNFLELETRLKRFESQTTKIEGIGKITAHSDRLHIIGTQGTELGIFPLPKLVFNMRGVWKPNKQYIFYDLVYIENKVMACIKPHLSRDIRQDQETCWKVFMDFTPLALAQKVKGKMNKEPQRSFNPCLAIYEKATLPKETDLGSLGILVGETQVPVVIYFDGKLWRYISSQQEI